jgi:Uma2 family endonuclease
MLNKTPDRTIMRCNDSFLPRPRNNPCGTLHRESGLFHSPDAKRSRVSVRLAAALLRQLDNFGTVLQAPCDVRLSYRDIVQPDIVFILKERYGITGKGGVHGSPDMIVEIVSPATCRNDLDARRRLYSRFAVREYWIVNPENETIEVSVWCEMGYVQAGVHKKTGKVRSPLLPCLEFPLSEIFRN